MSREPSRNLALCCIMLFLLLSIMSSTCSAEVILPASSRTVSYSKELPGDPGDRPGDLGSPKSVAAMEPDSQPLDGSAGIKGSSGQARPGSSGLYDRISIDSAGDRNWSIQSLADSAWFALITGLASILGFIIAVYPIQIRHVPPSVFRALLWNRTLLMAAGCGLIVFSLIKFYNQNVAPDLPLLDILWSILRGQNLGDSATGPSIWGILLFVGIGCLIGGSKLDPAKKIRILMISEGKAVHEAYRDYIGNLTEQTPYDSLSPTDRELCDQAIVYYSMVQQRVVDILAGESIIPSGFRTSASAKAQRQVDQFLAALRRSNTPKDYDIPGDTEVEPFTNFSSGEGQR